MNHHLIDHNAFNSPDSSYVLTSICSESHYVIAGLTDGAGVEKDTSLIRAESFHIAKLPIKQVLQGGLRRSALNADIVANVLATAQQRDSNNDIPFGTDQYGRMHERQLKQLGNSDSYEWMKIGDTHSINTFHVDYDGMMNISNNDLNEID